MASSPAVPPELSRAARMRGYLKTFSIGIAVAAVVGAVVLVASSAGFASGFGYTLVAFGTLLMLIGGVAGGGYVEAGARLIDTLRGGPRPQSVESTPANYPAAAPVDLADIPKPSIPKPATKPRHRRVDPAAFWQVMGGFAYFALGSFVVLTFAS